MRIASLGREGEGRLRFALKELRSLTATLAQLGCTLALIYDTGLLVETTAAHLGQHTVSLDHFVEPAERRLKGLIIIDGHTRQLFHPLSCADYLSYRRMIPQAEQL